MAKTLLDLAVRMDKLRLNVGKIASKLAVETAVAVVTDLAYKTPIDTANALSNWHVSLATPSSKSVLPHFYYARNLSAQETIKLAREVLEGKKPGVRIFITNNEPYIRRLNEGYSAQAAAGFVERSVMIGRKVIKNFKLKV